MQLLLALAMLLAAGPRLDETAHAAGPAIYASWNETPALRIIYFWNLYERRDGKYAEDWSDNKLAAADTFLFGLRQAYLHMDITAHIAANHANGVWVELNNTVTNFPDENAARNIHDYPPHVNIHLPWRNPNWSGDTNNHVYTGEDGKVVGMKVNYSVGSCPTDADNLATGAWLSKRDGQCRVVYQERFTESGELQLRLRDGAPIYTLRNKGVSDLDVLRDGELLYNVRRVFHDAAIAKMVWEIRDYTQNKLITETFVADPITGALTDHTKAEAPLEGALVNITPLAPANGATDLPSSPVLRATAAYNGDAADAPPSLTVTFYGREAVSAAVAPFTIVAIPDTQMYTLSDSGAALFRAQTQWIVDQRAARNIVFASHLGDIVEYGGTDLAQWDRASAAMAILDNADLPNGLAVGNHDLDIPNDESTDWTVFDQYFPPSRYSGFEWYGGYQGDPDDGIEDFGVNRLNKNSYQLFSTGGMDFIALHLEMDPPQYAIDWGNAVLAAHASRRAIVTTHAYVTPTGNRRLIPDTRSTIGKSAQYLWENLVFPNCNVFLVLNGHYPDEARRTDPNRCGVPVHQVLQDYQGRTNGGDGWLRYFVFEPDEDEIEVYTYSPTLDQYEEDENSRFTLAYDMEAGATGTTSFSALGSVTVPPGGIAEFAWQGLALGASYEWYAVASAGQSEATSPIWRFTMAATDGPSAPSAQNDSYTVNEDQVLEIAAPGVLANDQGLSSQARASIVSPPAHGELALAEDGSLRFTPALHFHGIDSFTYAAVDGSGRAEAAVTITVHPVNDAPAAIAQTITTTIGAPVTIALGGDDADGDSLTYAIGEEPAHGALSGTPPTLTYTPAAGYLGSDSFTFIVSDGVAASQPAVVSVVVTPLTPTAMDDHLVLDRPVLFVSPPGVLTNDLRADDQPLRAVQVTGPQHGALTLQADGSFIYTPTVDFVGEDSFQYKATDGATESNVATVNIAIEPEGASQNDGTHSLYLPSLRR